MVLILLMATVRTLRSLLNDKATERIDDLLRRFGELKESFDRGVGVQAMRQMLSIGEWLVYIYRTHI